MNSTATLPPDPTAPPPNPAPTMLDEALLLAQSGFADFPCHGVELDVGRHSLPSTEDGDMPAPKFTCTCGKPTCTDAGKHPWTKHGLKDATTDPTKIRGWNRKWKAGANLAVRGGDGLLLLDHDSYKPGAKEALAEVENECGPLPRDWLVETGNGGLQFWLRLPEVIKIRSVNGWRHAIDVKSQGGYCIVPPSRHLSGREYTWLSRIGDRPPLLPASWLRILPLVKQSDQRPLHKPHRPERAGIQSDRVTELIRNSVTLYQSNSREDCRHFILDAIEECVCREKDTHNNQRMRLARTLKCRPELRDVDGESLEWAYREWFDRSLPVVDDNHKDWQRSFAQWINLWDWVEIDKTQEAPFVAYHKALTSPLPAAAAKYKSRTKRQLLGWCKVLQEDHADEHGTFFLSNRKAAELLEVTKDIVCSWMGDFVRDKLLVKVCRECWAEGTIITVKDGDKRCTQCTACGCDPVGGHKAMRYRYVGDTVNVAPVVESTAA